jgi:hypothetical protein
MVPKGVAIGPGDCGNWPGGCQDPWKYIDAKYPPIKFKQVLRPESHPRPRLADKGGTTRNQGCWSLGSQRESKGISMLSLASALLLGEEERGQTEGLVPGLLPFESSHH